MHCIHKALSNFTVFTHLFGTKPQFLKVLRFSLHPLWWTINNVNPMQQPPSKTPVPTVKSLSSPNNTALLNKSPSDENMCTADFENRQQLVR